MSMVGTAPYPNNMQLAAAPAMDGSADDSQQQDQPDQLTEEDVQSIVAIEVEHSINFIQASIAPDRVKATEYYRGLPFGDEETGRSKFISRDVADTVNSMVPGLMRMFFGPEHVVEYVATGPDDVDKAEQATDYANYIFTKDNPGFLILHALIKDMLIRKCGIARCDWDKSRSVTVETYTQLDMMDVTQLQQQFEQSGTEFEIISAHQNQDGTADVQLKLKRSRDSIKIAAIPLDEFFCNPECTGFGPGEYRTLGHGRAMSVSDLVGLGYSKEDLATVRGESIYQLNAERQARMPFGSLQGNNAAGDDSQELVWYAEVYTMLDQDGDGLAELWKFCVAGAGYKILRSEIVDEHPFAEFPCDPEPHTPPVNATSIADKTCDLQKTKSGVSRAMFDSLSLAVQPRTVVAKKGVVMSDVLNTEMGAVIRADNVNMVQPLIMPFVGKEAFPMLAYLDEVRENRTGMSRVSMGLDPAALQNVTALAAANQYNKAHEMQELIARIMAETGFKRLFRRILRLMIQNQRKDRMVNLRGRWIKVNPSTYNSDMEVTANVALGGTQSEKIQALQTIAQKQETIMMTLGPNNPLVGLKEYWNTLSKALPMIGFKNVNSFFKDPDMSPPLPVPGQKPDPKAENDKAKIQLQFIQHQDSMAQQQADRQQATMLKLYEINVRNNTQLSVADIKAHAEAMRVAADLHISANAA